MCLCVRVRVFAYASMRVCVCWLVQQTHSRHTLGKQSRVTFTFGLCEPKPFPLTQLLHSGMWLLSYYGRKIIETSRNILPKCLMPVCGVIFGRMRLHLRLPFIQVWTVWQAATVCAKEDSNHMSNEPRVCESIYTAAMVIHGSNVVYIVHFYKSIPNFNLYICIFIHKRDDFVREGQ